MIKRQTAGSVVCPECGRLVGVHDERCLHCGRRNPGLWGWGPALARLGGDFGFTQVVIGGCVALYLIALVLSPDGIQMGGDGLGALLGFLAPDVRANAFLGASGALPVFGYGRWWTVLSAAWLHGGLLHIFFNLYWVRQMVPAVRSLYGLGRLLIIYTVASITGFGLTSLVFFLQLPGPLAGAQITLGASAPLFGLFGAVYLYGQRTGNRALSSQMIQFLLFMLVFGLVMPGLDNWAHIGGFAGGYLCARALHPLAPEQQQHLLLGLLCLVATVLAILASVLHGLRLGWPGALG